MLLETSLLQAESTDKRTDFMKENCSKNTSYRFNSWLLFYERRNQKAPMHVLFIIALYPHGNVADWLAGMSGLRQYLALGSRLRETWIIWHPKHKDWRLEWRKIIRVTKFLAKSFYSKRYSLVENRSVLNVLWIIGMYERNIREIKLCWKLFFPRAESVKNNTCFQIEESLSKWQFQKLQSV